MACLGRIFAVKNVPVIRRIVEIFEVPLLVLPQIWLLLSTGLKLRRLQRVLTTIHLPGPPFLTPFKTPPTDNPRRIFRPNPVTELGRIRKWFPPRCLPPQVLKGRQQDLNRGLTFTAPKPDITHLLVTCLLWKLVLCFLNVLSVRKLTQVLVPVSPTILSFPPLGNLVYSAVSSITEVKNNFAPSTLTPRPIDHSPSYHVNTWTPAHT